MINNMHQIAAVQCFFFFFLFPFFPFFKWMNWFRFKAKDPIPDPRYPGDQQLMVRFFFLILQGYILPSGAIEQEEEKIENWEEEERRRFYLYIHDISES